MNVTFYKGKVEDPFIPFSNGTEAMIWESENCERCSKAWYPKDGNWPKESTIRDYVRLGKYCKLQYWLHIGWIEGTIPYDIAKQIGLDQHDCLKTQCMMWSDNENDGFHYPKKPPVDPVSDNQLTMPFLFDELEIPKIKEQFA